MRRGSINGGERVPRDLGAGRSDPEPAVSLSERGAPEGQQRGEATGPGAGSPFARASHLPHRLLRDLQDARGALSRPVPNPLLARVGGQLDRQSRAKARSLRRALTIPGLHPAPDLSGLDLARLERIDEAVEVLTGGGGQRLTDLWSGVHLACLTGDRRSTAAVETLLDAKFLSPDQFGPDGLTMAHTLALLGGAYATDEDAAGRVSRFGADEGRGFAPLDERVSLLAKAGADLDASLHQLRLNLRRDLRQAGAGREEIRGEVERLRLAFDQRWRDLGGGDFSMKAYDEPRDWDELIGRTIHSFASPLMKALLSPLAGPRRGRERPDQAPVALALIRHGADLDRPIALKGVARAAIPLLPLHAAAKLHGVEVVRALLDRGADPLAADENGDTALHWAVLDPGNAANVEALLAATDAALVNTANKGGALPLHHAASVNDNLDIVDALIDASLPRWAMARTSFNETALHVAARQPGNASVVRRLAERGDLGALEIQTRERHAFRNASADIRDRAEMGCTPLHYAVSLAKDLEAARALIERYELAAWDGSNAGGQRELELRRSQLAGAERGVGRASRRDAAPSPQQDDGAPPDGGPDPRSPPESLGWAMARRDWTAQTLDRETREHLGPRREEAARHLRRWINLPNRDGDTALDLAAASNEPELVKLLIAKGADVDSVPADRGSPRWRGNNLLVDAVRSGNHEIVGILIAAGARVHLASLALSAAARSTDPRLLRSLLGSDPDVLRRSPDFGHSLLHEAAGVGNNADVVEALLEAGAGRLIGRPTSPDGEEPSTPVLHRAAAHPGNHRAVDLLLAMAAERLGPDNRSAFVNALDGEGRTALEIAAAQPDSLEVIRGLIAAGGAPAPDAMGPLRLLRKAAERASQPEAVDLLMTLDLPLDGRTEDGSTVAHALAASRHAAVVAHLMGLGCGAQIADAAADGRRPLHVAVAGRRLDVIEAFLREDAGRSTNEPDRIGHTPLYMAAKNGDADVVRLLLNAGAAGSIGLRTKVGATPLHIASLLGGPAVVRLLLENGAGAFINEPMKDGYTPLLLATSRGDESPSVEDQLAVVGMLLGSGADVHATGDGANALHHAVTWPGRNADIIGMLADRGIALDDKADMAALRPDDEELAGLHWSALQMAVMGGNHEAVGKLLELGADASVRDMGGSPLMHMRLKDSLDGGWMAHALVDAGIDVRDRDDDGNNPLHVHLATRRPDLDLIELLLVSGVDVNAENDAGETALHVAARSRSTRTTDEVVAALLDAGADIRRTTKEGSSVLLEALLAIDEAGESDFPSRLAEVKLPLMRRFLEQGGAVDGVDASGRSALHLALDNGHTDALIPALLDRSTDLLLVDRQGISAVDVASRRWAEERGRSRRWRQPPHADTLSALRAVIDAEQGLVRSLRDAGAPVGERLQSLERVVVSLAAADPAAAPVMFPRSVHVGAGDGGEGSDAGIQGAEPPLVAARRRANQAAFARSMDRALSIYRDICRDIRGAGPGNEGDLAGARALVDAFPAAMREAAEAAMRGGSPAGPAP